MKINFKKLHPDTKIPSYGHQGDAGLDLFAMKEESIAPGEHALMYVGFALEIPIGYGAFVMDKSSISKAGLHIMGGVFDAGYRGEYNVHLVNLSDKTYTFEKGDKIGQLIILPVVSAELEEVDELSESMRGTGAFGSTGKK